MSGRDQSTDPVAQWRSSRDRVAALVAQASAEELQRRVPACPDWTCLDLLRHMVGLAADVLDGDEPDDHHEAWTRAQVEGRQGRDATALLAEWDRLAEPLVAWMRTHGSRPLNDVVIHEQDLRGALDRPGARDCGGLRIVRERMLEKLGAALAGRPPLALVGETFTWTSHGDSPERAGTLLRAADFDLARAAMSRRTTQQLASYAVRGDVAPYLEAFARMGPPPEQPLPE